MEHCEIVYVLQSPPKCISMQVFVSFMKMASRSSKCSGPLTFESSSIRTSGGRQQRGVIKCGVRRHAAAGHFRNDWIGNPHEPLTRSEATKSCAESALQSISDEA